MKSDSADAVPAFPFTALHGQARLQCALLLAAVDPLIGGVLIEGARGTAKSTSARSLADLLPGGRFVDLPLGSSEEQLVGSLDLEAVLNDGRVRFRPGLLARAHEGVLYVDEVNLLADGLVDLLLDACASGINRVERDGVSHQHEARITLVGTMNPEEGELRPQLLDRFGLFVRLDDVPGPADRQAIVRARLAYDADPFGFARRHEAAQRALAARIAAARAALAGIAFTDADHERVAALCHAARVEGVRADLVMLRAARAQAALAGRTRIAPADIEEVAELALAHRRKAEADESAAAPPARRGDEGTTDEGTTDEGTPTASASGSGQGGADAAQDDAQRHGRDWGALPPQPVPIRTVKQARPLHAKKS